MSTDTLKETKAILQGGDFLVKETEVNSVFTPEDFNEEQVMFGQMVTDFVKTKVHPVVEKLDKQEPGLMEHLLAEASELGILGAALPDEYNGMGVNIITESLMAERMGTGHSFAVAYAAHTGIGTLPIVYYGTKEQKEKYLPKFATGEIKASYCLTEPGSGSDALSAKTKAVLSEDGKYYTLDGQKMWITNAGFADLFIVFAQVDGDKFSCFIVEGDSKGLNLGAEEDKMGIKGSSTRQVFFEGVKVPVENVLGEIGKGHKIAFNVLNIGRHKLCAMVLGGCKGAAEHATKYANERIQFKVPISSFGAIKHKLAQMAVLTYAAESASYRSAGMISDKVDKLIADGKSANRAEAKKIAADEYSIECAMMKVLGSEALDYCVDEAVQVYGGTGFSEEYPVARAYRDARINKIFEGTNEINRLLTVGMTMRKAMKGKIDLFGPAMAVQKELSSMPSFGNLNSDDFFAAEKAVIVNAKKAILMVAGAAAQKFEKDLEKEQEVMMNIADMMILTFTAESVLLRVEKLIANKGKEAAAIQIDLAKTYLSDAVDNINKFGKNAICGFAEGDMLRMMLMGLKRFTKQEPLNTIASRRRIAEAMIEANDYCF